MYRLLNRKCQECGGRLVEDIDNGEIACNRCGLVDRVGIRTRYLKALSGPLAAQKTRAIHP